MYSSKDAPEVLYNEEPPNFGILKDVNYIFGPLYCAATIAHSIPPYSLFHPDDWCAQVVRRAGIQNHTR